MTLPQPLPSVTTFERAVSDAADRIIAVGKTGYHWDSVDKLLKDELKTELGEEGQTRCKQARNSGRAANVLTESNDKNIALYLVFIHKPYTVEQFRRVAKDRIARFPNVKTVAVAEQVDSTWRVTEIVEREGVGLAAQIAGHFPLVSSDKIYPVPAGSESAPVAEVHRPDEGIFASAATARPTSVQGLGSLSDQLRALATANGVSLDATTAVDTLAAVLSSQMVLFAGPSGTGKSTLARLMSAFITGPDNSIVLEAGRGWQTPEDMVGYFSALSTSFAQTPSTEMLIDLHELCAAALSNENTALTAPVPVLLVEEINLSTIEGYLSPVMHGLSRPATPYLRWQLHAQREGVADIEDALTLPPELLFGPWPRIFGTINVDANSPAPARKVAARASVVLLEPDAAFNVNQEVERLSGGDPVATLVGDHIGVAVGDPTAARRELSDAALRSLVEAFSTVLKSAEGSRQLVPSRRDIDRALNYMAYYVKLADGNQDSADAARRAAENALLHVVLPQLPAHAFTTAVRALSAASLEGASADMNTVGGLLAPRVSRLSASITDALFSDTVDFWTALS